VATPTDGATPLLFYVNCAACEATLVTPTPTPTPTLTQTATPTVTATPTSTDSSSITTYTISGCTNLNVLVVDLGPGFIVPGDVNYYTFTGATPSGCYSVIGKINAPIDDAVTASFGYGGCNDCEISNITPTPTETETPTPTTTPTNTETPTNTPTPSTTPIPVTGYGFNLVVLPYEFPTTGNTIINSTNPATSGSTNPNELETSGRGIYWNSIDTDGIDRTNYFSQFTGQSVTITMTQTGSTAIYSGDSQSLKYWTTTGDTGFVFGTGINVPPGTGTTGTTVLIQSASTNWVTGQTVYISVEINSGVTPTPTPTNTQTPTNTPTETETPTPTPSATRVYNTTFVNNSNNAQFDSFFDNDGNIPLIDATGSFPVTSGQTLSGDHGNTADGASIGVTGTGSINIIITLNGVPSSPSSSSLPASLSANLGGALSASDTLVVTIYN
jgi:hypothetical protein